MDLTNLVALRWTFSISFCSILNLGSHITVPYSNRGLIKALYNGKKTGGVKLVKFLLTVPTLLLAFATIDLI
jgi:hypothetical protein